MDMFSEPNIPIISWRDDGLVIKDPNFQPSEIMSKPCGYTLLKNYLVTSSLKCNKEPIVYPKTIINVN